MSETTKHAVTKNGKLAGWYYVYKGMITVIYVNGHEKSTRASDGDNAGFARLILSEPEML